MRIRIIYPLIFLGILLGFLPLLVIFFRVQAKTTENSLPVGEVFIDIAKTSVSNTLSDTFKICDLLNERIKNLPEEEMQKEKSEAINYLREYLSSVKIGTRGYVWIVETINDNDAIVILGKEAGMSGKLLSRDLDYFPDQSTSSLIKTAKALKENELHTFVIRGKTNNSIKEDDRINVYGNYENWNWIIGAAYFNEDFSNIAIQSAKDVNSSFSLQTIYLSCGLLVLILLLALFISFAFSKHINPIIATAKLLKDGDLYAARKSIRFLLLKPFFELDELSLMQDKIAVHADKLFTQTLSTQKTADKIIQSSWHISSVMSALESVLHSQELSANQLRQIGESISAGTHFISKQMILSEYEFAYLSTASKESYDAMYLSLLRSEKLKKFGETFESRLEEINSALKLLIDNFSKISNDNASMISLNISISAEKLGEKGSALAVLSKELFGMAKELQSSIDKINTHLFAFKALLETNLHDAKFFVGNIEALKEAENLALEDAGNFSKSMETLKNSFVQMNSFVKEKESNAKILHDYMSELIQNSEKIFLHILHSKNSMELVEKNAEVFKDKISSFKL